LGLHPATNEVQRLSFFPCTDVQPKPYKPSIVPTDFPTSPAAYLSCLANRPNHHLASGHESYSLPGIVRPRAARSWWGSDHPFFSLRRPAPKQKKAPRWFGDALRREGIQTFGKNVYHVSGLGQAAVNCRAMPPKGSCASLVRLEGVAGSAHSECRREAGKRAAEPAPIILATTHHSRSTLGQRKSPARVRRGAGYTWGQQRTGEPWGGNPPVQRHKEPRDCPKFRPPASRAALIKVLQLHGDRFRLGSKRFAYLLVERRGLRSDRHVGKKRPPILLAASR